MSAINSLIGYQLSEKNAHKKTKMSRNVWRIYAVLLGIGHVVSVINYYWDAI